MEHMYILFTDQYDKINHYMLNDIWKCECSGMSEPERGGGGRGRRG